MATYKRFQGKRVRRGEKDYPKGTWYAQGQADGVRYHQALKTAKTKDDADKMEANIISKIRVDEFSYLKDKTSFADFIDTVYLPYSELNNESYKQKIYECNYLKKHFKGVLLKSVSPQMCEQYKAWRKSQRVRCQKCVSGTHKGKCEAPFVANSTVNRELTTLKKLLNLAVANRRIKDNPMRFVKMMDEPPARMRILSIEEKQRLFIALKEDKKLLTIVLLALLTGWRKGQILGVRKKDLDYKFQAVNRKKSKRSPAQLAPVSTPAWNIFTELAELADDYLFTNRDGRPLGDFKESWWDALKTAGIKDFRFHDLRHSFSTEVLIDGANVFTIRDLLGHAQIETTQIYAQVTDNKMRDALEKQGENYKEFLM